MSNNDTVQVLLILDLSTENPLQLEELKALLPHERERREIYKLTDFGVRAGGRGTPVDWTECAEGITKMLDKARKEASRDGWPVQFYVAGRAALPVFAAVGCELSKWATVTLLNQRPDGTWDVLPITAKAVSEPSQPFFSNLTGIITSSPSEAGGHVAVFVATTFRAARDGLRKHLVDRGLSLAGVVEASAGGATLDSSNVDRVASELVDILAKAKASYPHASGIVLFVAGPATLAFVAGRAVNLNVLAEVHVPNFENGNYVSAVILPVTARAARVLPADPESARGRKDVLERAAIVISTLSAQLKFEHLPGWMEKSQRALYLKRLQRLSLDTTDHDGEFTLDVTEGTVALGGGLLEALRRVDPKFRDDIVRALLLHEVYHCEQGIRTATYRGVGRAGFALEEIDYWADAFALSVLQQVDGRPPNALVEIIGGILRGIEAFDRYEQGDRIAVLSERRLRRYLIWNLQRARAMTIRESSDAQRLLEERPIVELAPLASKLDVNQDKIVEKSTDETHLFIVCCARMIRVPCEVRFQPEQIIEAVRVYQHDLVTEAMRFVREQHPTVLAQWSP